MSGEGDIPLSGSADDRTHLLSDEDAQKWDDLMDKNSN
jgi:hypothetical protein